MALESPTGRSDERSVSLLLRKAAVPHRLIDVGAYARTAEEAAGNLGAPLASIVKSLVCVAEGTVMVAMVPGDRALSFERLDHAAGTLGCKLAGRSLVERTTGYIVGGVAPVGLPAGLPVYGDASILDLPVIYCGAGSDRHMLQIAPRDLCSVAAIEWSDLCT